MATFQCLRKSNAISTTDDTWIFAIHGCKRSHRFCQRANAMDQRSDFCQYRGSLVEECKDATDEVGYASSLPYQIVAGAAQAGSIRHLNN